MVDAFLQHLAELVPELEVAVLLRLLAVLFDFDLAFLGEVFEQRERLLHNLLLDEASGRILLQDLTRDVERQVLAVDHAAHEAQPLRQDLLRVVHDEHALHEQANAALLAVRDVMRRLLGNEQEAGQFVRAFDLEVRPRERVVPVVARVLVELDVLVLRDLALAAGPQRASLVDGLPLRASFLVLAALDLHADRPAHIVAVLAHDGLNRPLLEVLLRVFLDVQRDVRAAAFAFAEANFVVALRLALPDPGLVATGSLRADRDRVRDQERRIEADAELADHRDVLLLLGRQRLHQLLRARARDRAEVRDQVVLRHADAVVADRQRALLLVGDQFDAQLGVAAEDRRVGQRLQVEVVDRIARVADQLAEEHLAMAVERVDDDREDLVDFGLEYVLFDGRAHGCLFLRGAKRIAICRTGFKSGGGPGRQLSPPRHGGGAHGGMRRVRSWPPPCPQPISRAIKSRAATTSPANRARACATTSMPSHSG